MKKRLLGLALALVMIISLLPLTTLAASPMPKFQMKDPNGNLESYFNDSNTVYVVYEDVLDTDGTTVIGNKPVVATEIPTDNYIKYEFNTAAATATITMKNINYKRVSSAGDFMTIVVNGSNYSNEFDVVLVLEGTNSIECPNDLSDNKYENCDACIILEHAGNTTITGTGSLTASVPVTGNTFFWSKKAGDLKIENVTLDFYLPNTNNGTIAGFCINGAIAIENANVTISGYGYSEDDGAPTTRLKAKLNTLITGTKYGTRIDDTTKGITFSKGSVVELTGGSTTAVQTKGAIVIDNATVTMQKGTGNQSPFASSMPTVTGCDSVQIKKNSGASPSFKDWDNSIAAGTALTTTVKLVGFKTVHTCAAQADDGDCSTAVTCACGKEATPAKQHTGVVTDCTKDTMCTNAGCTKVYAAKLGTAHTPGADDGDCTTDIKCANCEQVATKGAEKHVWDRTNCDVAGTCTTAGCTKTIEAGAHSGGTATCKDKAKCAECGKEYGELGACAPAADDGDCTTDIKCSVCGKTTTAGAAAHKYTDKNDTTCDNAGCTNTRKVEGTENPKTGDNSAIAVVAALMVTAAAAFVTTKKFAR